MDAGSPKHSRWAEVILAAVMTVVSVLAINRYRYGLYDHAIAIPFLKSLVNPALYRSDYILPARSLYVSALWPLLAVPVRLGLVGLPALLFGCHVVSILFTFLAIHRIALALFRRQDAAILSVFFALFSKPVLGGVHTLDLAFYPRVAALPLLLFAVDSFLRGAYVRCWTLQGIAFLIHPLTAVYASLGLSAAALVSLDRIGRRPLLRGLAIFAMLAVPLLVWQHLHAPASLRALHADPVWVQILRLRSPQHLFPFSWPAREFLRAALFLGTFAWSFRFPPPAFLHRAVVAFCGVTLASWIAGTVLTEISPVPLVIQLQFFRGSTFLYFLSAIYVAHACVILTERASHRATAQAAACAAAVLYDATIWRYALAGLIALLAVRHGLFAIPNTRSRRLWPLGLVAIAALLGMGVYIRKDPFTIGSSQRVEWLAAQRWAAQHTGVRDLFIVPPQSTGFRVESERAIYGDWKDGTLMFFDPAFGTVWMRRMRALGFREDRTLEEGYAALREQDFRKIAAEVAAPGVSTYLVTTGGRPDILFPVVFRNEAYVVYRLPGPPGGPRRSRGR